MKKKLLSILLVTATLLCFGCGGGSSSATNSGNSGGSANNSSDSKQTGDLYGTKKPVSATYTFNQNGTIKGPHPMTFEFNDDGTYVATVEFGMTHVKLYFSSKRVIEKWETYDSSMQKVKAGYCINGVSSIPGSECTYGVDRTADGILREFYYSNSKPDYDNNGNITNTTTISEKDDLVREYASSGDVSIERDADGRITKTSLVDDTFFINRTYYTKYIYSDASVFMLSYESNIFVNGYKITYDSHGAISEAVIVEEDGSEKWSKNTYTYDDYGFLTSIKIGSSNVLTIEYTY